MPSYSDGVFSGRQGRREESRGSILIIVIWVVGLLSLLISSFAFDAHLEAKITSYYRNRTKAESLTKSGVELAELLMLKSGVVKNKTEADQESAKVEWWSEPAKRLSEGLPIRGFVQPLGEGTITLDIVPEPARRNVNLLKEEDWQRVLDVGGIPQEMCEGLIDSVLDWIDADEVTRPKGAETEDHYSKLESPYRSKNAPFDTVGEVLLVKGFTRPILSGGVIETNETSGETIRVSGIEDLLTTYGDGKVNINAASQRVLMTLPGVDEILAGAIVEEREGTTDADGKTERKSFRDVNDLFARIPGLDPGVKAYISTDSAIFRITSVGTVHSVKKTVWCIVRYANKQMTILQWREEE